MIRTKFLPNEHFMHLSLRVTCVSTDQLQHHEAVLNADDGNVVAITGLHFYKQYNCCVEAGYIDFNENSSSCVAVWTEEGGIIMW